MPVTTESLQNELDATISAARQAVKLIDIPDNISQRQRRQIDTINKKLLSTAEKQAKATFAVQIAERLAQNKRQELNDSAIRRAARRRREHLAFALGGELLRIQHFERNFLCNFLQAIRNNNIHNRIIKELQEFCGLAILNQQHVRQEIIEAKIQRGLQ